MACRQMIEEMEKKLKRKLTEEEKRKIMEAHQHSEEEILDETNEGNLVYA